MTNRSNLVIVGGTESTSFVGLVVVFAILFIVIIIVASQYEKRKREERRKELGELASSLGLQFFPEGPGSGPAKSFLETLFSFGSDGPEDRLMAQFEGFTPFGQGHSQSIESLLAGSSGGVDWLVFDYQYKITTSTGKTTTTTTYPPSIVAAKLPIILPWLTLSGESLLTRLGERLGVHDLHFESEEFNNKYRVKCPDRKLAFDLLHPQVIEYFLQLPVRDWQMGGPFVVLKTPSWASAKEYVRMMEDIKGFVKLIPDYVEQDRGFQLAPGGPLQGIMDESNG